MIGISGISEKIGKIGSAHLRLIVPSLLLLGAAAGCGGRAAFWSSPIDSSPPAFGLPGAVALVDAQADRVVLLTPGAGQSLTTSSIAVGPDILNAVPSPDGTKLFVVSGGHRAGIGDSRPDESPSLTVIDPSGATVVKKYLFGSLTDPLAGLAIDPGGQWVVLYAGSGSNQPFVANPNELLILDVTQPPETATPVTHTLMSFGGRPERFTFTPPLVLPIPRPLHLLVVESDQGLSLLQLENPQIPEISVPLTNGSDTSLLTPAGIAVDPGGANDGARIGVRLANDTDIVTLQFVAEPGADLSVENGFVPTVNLTDVGGIASDLAFVNIDPTDSTGGGLRLAALVPSKSKATLIDPVTTLTEDVPLPAPYQNLSLVTAPNATAANVALLWNGASAVGQEGVAFWDLGQTSGQPYRSIQTVGITDVISGILDVPQSPNPSNPAPDQLKVLETAGASAFYVLDLTIRTAAPLLTSISTISLSMSPLGDQVWTFVPGGTQVAATTLIHAAGTALTIGDPRSLLIERPVSQVFEIDRGSGQDPAAVVIHDEGSIGATVYDAATLDDKTRRLYAGLLTGGAP
jgi:hypothetical protein